MAITVDNMPPAGYTPDNPGCLLIADLAKMLVDGLIQEIEPRLGALSEDERRRTYRLTKFGRQVAAAEAERSPCPEYLDRLPSMPPEDVSWHDLHHLADRDPEQMRRNMAARQYRNPEHGSELSPQYSWIFICRNDRLRSF